MAEIMELECGCESALPEWDPVSWCGRHQQGMAAFDQSTERMYRCGECGFQSEQWERLERHVYREHLGVRCA